jgi:hypothetical protein
MAEDQRAMDQGLEEKLGCSRERFATTDCKLLF